MDIFSSQKSTQPSARYPSMAELPQDLQGLVKQGTSALQSPASLNIQNLLASLAGPAAGQVGATLSGAYLPTSPTSNPYIAAIIDALNKRQEQDTSRLRSLWGGQGLGMREGLQRAEADLSSGYAGQEGQLLQNLYQTERGNQLGVLPYAMGMYQFPFNLAERLAAPLMTPLGQTTTETPSLFAQLLKGATAAAELGWQPFAPAPT